MKNLHLIPKKTQNWSNIHITSDEEIKADIGWHSILEKPPIENDYIELMFDNGLTTKRHWNISILNETEMNKPLYWRACR
jgi:hypothetical protein